MNLLEELKHKDIWSGEYKGIRFEIAKWKPGSDHYCWNYYLYLPIAIIPNKLRKNFILKGKYEKFSKEGNTHLIYHYNSNRYLQDLDWHGGITYYDKLLDGEGKLRAIKLGCDYEHLFDMENGYSYDLACVLMETRQTIDKLREVIPLIKEN